MTMCASSTFSLVLMQNCFEKAKAATYRDQDFFFCKVQILRQMFKRTIGFHDKWINTKLERLEVSFLYIKMF